MNLDVTSGCVILLVTSNNVASITTIKSLWKRSCQPFSHTIFTLKHSTFNTTGYGGKPSNTTKHNQAKAATTDCEILANGINKYLSL